MSTAPNPPIPEAGPTPPVTRSPEEVEIKIVSHSNLFYWWPVWAIGFIMAGLTFIDNHRVAIVPHDTIVGHGGQGAVKVDNQGRLQSVEGRDVLVAPEGAKFEQPRIHIATSKNYGVLWAIILLLVILITNVHLRGLWSVIVIVVIVMSSIIFALAGWWDRIFDALGLLHIYLNAGGYLFISLILFGIWLVTFTFFDRTVYMVFTPGQLRACTEIGGGEQAYDTTGMTIEKHRSDLFRHWILGLGSGDLTVNTTGAAVHHFDLPNVLFIGRKVQAIEDMLREKAVVRGR